MNSVFKNLFSNRHGLVPVQSILTKDTISKEIVNAIGSCYDVLCEGLKRAYNKYNYSWSHLFLQQDIERELWIHFANRRLGEFKVDGNHYYLVFNELLIHGKLPWYRILDLVEYVCKWISFNVANYPYLDELLRDFESNINHEFDRLDYGYRVVSHCIMDITSDEELSAIDDAITHSKDNVRNHLQSAIEHYSSRPTPDVRNSIKESISAVEAICRELTGDDTLGKSLKNLEEKGVIIHKTLKDAFTKFYVYSNDQDSGIRHALMDEEGTYVPSKDEAYYMLVTCSAFVNYLRRKAAP